MYEHFLLSAILFTRLGNRLEPSLGKVGLSRRADTDRTFCLPNYSIFTSSG